MSCRYDDSAFGDAGLAYKIYLIADLKGRSVDGNVLKIGDIDGRIGGVRARRRR